MEPAGNAGDGGDCDPGRDRIGGIDQPAKLEAEGMGQGLGEGREQHPRIGGLSGQPHRAVQGDDGFAGPGRAGDAGRPAIAAFDQLPLGRMEEDRPLFPGILQRLPEVLEIGHRPEPPPGVGVREGVGGRGRDRRRPGPAAGRNVQQGLDRLLRHVAVQIEQVIRPCLPDPGDPIGRHAKAEQIVVAETCERGALSGRPGRRDQAAPGRLVHHVMDELDELGGAGPGMHLNPAAFGPGVSLVMAGDVAQQEIVVGLVDDDAQAVVDPDGPEIRVPAVLHPVETQPGCRAVELQVKGGGLGRLLLPGRQAEQAGGEAVGDTEFQLRPQK